MDRERILDLYEWADDVCFRHPSKGVVPTAVVGCIHPRDDGERKVRGCIDCVVAMEDIRREQAARAGRAYKPGQLGGRGGMGRPSCEHAPLSGEDLGRVDPWGASGEGEDVTSKDVKGSHGN